MKKHTRIIAIILLLVLALVTFNKNIKSAVQTADKTLNATTTSNPGVVGLSNPASTNCVEKGGNLVIKTKEDGGQYGLCYFDDNRACEEWAMFRGECPVGGVKTTGYDTVDQMFCAWSGGKTLAEKDSKCTFSNGKVCATIDFYKGTCTK